MQKILLPAIEKRHLKLKLHDINGEYAEKLVDKEDEIYAIKDTHKTKKKRTEGETEETEPTSERNLAIEGTTHDTLTRKVKKKVHAFPRNGINQPLVPLGGARGYLIGALVAIAKTIGNQQGQPLYGFHSWVQNGGVKIAPNWVALPVKDVKEVNFFVKEARGKVYYEQVPEAIAEIDVEVTPKNGFNADLVHELLKRASNSGVSISPKRRGWFEIIECS